MAAKLAILKILSHPKGKNHVPWWNEECKKAIKERNKAYKEAKNTVNSEALMK